MTRMGLLGEKLGHSLSAAIHEAFLAQRGLSGTYRLYERTPGEVDDLRRWMAREDIGGLNVTIPYKQRVLPLMDDLTDAARAIGAVNTIARVGDRLIGHNTDAAGFHALLNREGIAIAGQRFAVLGATGGAARAVIHAIRDAGGDVLPVSRSGGLLTYDALTDMPFDVLVNCTPVGMAGHVGGSPVDASIAARAPTVVDLIYNPPETQLMIDARAAGGCAHNGLYMLVAQALAAQAFWRCEPMDPGAVEPIYRGLVRGRGHIALVGLPGSGKSALGRRLADALHLEFVDVDAALELQSGLSITRWFEERGEVAFRAAEAALTQSLAGAPRVLATGGGVVLDPCNVTALRSGGLVVWLDRSVESILEGLDATNRPLLARDPGRLRALAQSRQALYRAAAHVRVVNDGGIDMALRQLL